MLCWTIKRDRPTRAVWCFKYYWSESLDLSVGLSHYYDQEMNSWNNLRVDFVGTAELA